MSSNNNASQLQKVLDLLEEKQQNPGNADIETNFFNKALEYLLASTVNHWWCTNATLPIARESLWLFSLPDHDPIVKYKQKLNTQLSSCTYCVQAYQNSKQSVKARYDQTFPAETVQDFFQGIETFDVNRVKSTFKSAQEGTFSMTNQVICSILEIIYAPHLLKDTKCDELLGKVFDLIQQTKSFPTFGTDTAIYIFRMSFYHHRIVRFWARKLLEKLITMDHYILSENDFTQVKALIVAMLTVFNKEENEDESKADAAMARLCPFEITKNRGEYWKSFRLAIGMASSDMLTACLRESNVSMSNLIQVQLSSSAEWLAEILKTMTAMLLKMQTAFWGKISKNSTTYYDIVKQICEHPVFQGAMQIAREGNTGKILQRDGSRYPDDKLMAKIKSMLEWLYPYWSSLRHTSVEKDITQKILDTTFGYFQMDTWGVMSRAYCAELGLQIIDQCLADDSVPVDKIVEYVDKIMGFAKTDATSLPVLVQRMPVVARSILSDLVDRDSSCLNKAFQTIFQIDDLASELDDEDIVDTTPKQSPYGPIWTAVKLCFNEDVHKYPWLVTLLFKAYANIASSDVPSIAKDSESRNESLSAECKVMLARFADYRAVVAKTLKTISTADWTTRKGLLTDKDMIQPVLHLICSPYLEIKQDAARLIQQYPRDISDQDLFHDFFYMCQPLKVLEAFNAILREFTALTTSPTLNVFKSVPSLAAFFSIQVNLMTSEPSGYLMTLIEMGPQKAKDEDGLVGEFWDVCWRTISIILDKGLQWASQYKPSAVVNLIVPILDTASQMMHSKKLFERAIAITLQQEQAAVTYDHINTMTDSLSHWIYVTRQDMISRLIPLTNTILNTLKKAEVKISVEAYDRFMTAATGVNSSKLTDGERESLFMALSAHEPTNFIFLNDDSDDEDVEWQAVNPSSSQTALKEASSVSAPSVIPSQQLSSSAPARKRQITLDQSFSNVAITSPTRPTTNAAKATTPKITSFFTTTATATDPHEISDDEIEEEFADIDYSQMPDEWFDANANATAATSRDVQQKQSKPTHFGQDAMQIDEPSLQQQQQQQRPSSSAPMVHKVGSDVKPKHTRFYPAESKQPTFAVTSKGRKLRPPTMGFTSKLKNLREEFRAERRLIATAKSPSAAGIVRQRYGGSQDNSSDSSDSSSDDGDDDDDAGLLGLISDMDGTAPEFKAANVQAESASVKALFDAKPKRTIKLIETPITNEFLNRKRNARLLEQKRRQKIAPNIDRLFKTLLSWDITETREIPPYANASMYDAVPSTFQTFDEYRAVFEPLLMLETWSQLLRAKEQLTQNDVLDRCIVEGRCHTNDFVDVTFGLPMSVITNNLSADDLICVANHFGNQFFDQISSFSTPPNDHSWKGKAFLGKVMNINQKKNMGEVVVRCYFAGDRISILNSISPKTSWNILKIMSLTTTVREYAALEGLDYYDLAQDIIKPKAIPKPKLSSASIQNCCTRYDVNEPQAVAIVSAMQKKKGFSLIQGPPGTGKTKTILALIVSLLDQRKRATSEDMSTSGKLLVCAPSNAAVDEIAKRLKEGVMTSEGLTSPNVVRIGVADSVNASVKDRILDKLIEAEMDASSGKDGAPGGKWGAKLDTLHQDIRNIQISLDDVDREITQAGSDMVQMSILRDKRKTLAQKLTKSRILLKDTYQDQKNYGKEMEISRVRARQKVFANADVVCATLSGSGHDMLTQMGVSFETVIVDEAAQSIEISSLIPLKFDTQRCILVGDPNQLPPTVMSTLATKHNYQQSLFMRLERNMASEINLLSIQYRMHPHISSFPSKMFYQSQLKDGPNMDKVSSAVWHALPQFPPYRFFNIMDGQEKLGRGKSIFNVAEADAAVALVDMLCTKLPTVKFASKIGVITPYKQQVGQLKSRFQKRFGNSILDVIDFNTVDGFQGQEKEIIIFSCVRAGYGRGIGFLADMRRMNVGLTRAKCSLFVLGNAHSLNSSEYWGDLVYDAQKRDLITNCEYPYFNHAINEMSIPHNIFERTVSIAKPKTIQYKKGPVRISAPSSHNNSRSPSSASSSDDERTTNARTGDKRKSGSSGSSSSNRKRRLDEDVEMRDIKQEEEDVKMTPSTFLEKVRQDKEQKLNASRSRSAAAVSFSAPTNSTSSERTKLSISDYRASRGLPPAASNRGSLPPPQRQSSTGANSSLFINRKKPAATRPKHTHTFPEGISAKEHAIMEHTAAKDRMRSFREEERRRDSRDQTPRKHVRYIDDIVEDAQNKYRRHR
ncbi:SEN1 N terminal-domain-containing protein [Mucor lusitanicus]|uniref:SEN1 N terminal-domain-containing protein n=1 Tax=Mucor circinelloides f. lusitanicus TaxID=29924 RepID=A0A8H4BMK7_MUCCL|nr:SEN1 N terminal-domain-containing protein [Mucor lusitanicus]